MRNRFSSSRYHDPPRTGWSHLSSTTAIPCRPEFPRWDITKPEYRSARDTSWLSRICVREVMPTAFCRARQPCGSFLKEKSFAWIDRGEHRYESLFHISAEAAQVDEQTHAVTATNPQAAGLVLRTLPAPGLRLEVVKGLEEEPVQGWANSPWRPVPTAIVRANGVGRIRLVTILEPTAPGKKSRIDRWPRNSPNSRRTGTPGLCPARDLRRKRTALPCPFRPNARAGPAGAWD